MQNHDLRHKYRHKNCQDLLGLFPNQNLSSVVYNRDTSIP